MTLLSSPAATSRRIAHASARFPRSERPTRRVVRTSNGDEVYPGELMLVDNPRPQHIRSFFLMLNISPTVSSRRRTDLGRIHSLPAFMQREERLRFAALELSHRSKNLLAVVQAIASQIGSRSVSLKDFQTQFRQRLQGLSRSLDLLVEEDGRGAWIADLVRNQLEPFGEVDGVRIAATGPAALLNADAAQNIGQALHELATNATKHGALSVAEGSIAVQWELGPGEGGQTCFRLRWRELNGPKVTPPTRSGFGHVVLKRTTGQALQGRANHEFNADGVRWTLEAPAARTVISLPPERIPDEATAVAHSRHGEMLH